MASKYSAELIGKLPRMVDNEASHQDHVNQRKTELRATDGFKETSVALAAQYAVLRETAKQVEAELKEINHSVDAVSQMLEEQYEAEGITSVRLTGGASVRIQVEPYALVKDKDIYRDWCVTQGLERLMSIPWMTTNSMTKERLLGGQEPPPGVEAFARTKLVLTKG